MRSLGISAVSPARAESQLESPACPAGATHPVIPQFGVQMRLHALVLMSIAALSRIHRHFRWRSEEALANKRATGEARRGAMRGKSVNVWGDTDAVTALMTLTACEGSPNEAPPRAPAGDPVLSVA